MSKPIFNVFEYQAQKLCDLWVLFLFIGQKCCVYTCMYRRFMSAGMHVLYVYMNPDVEFLKKCLKLCSSCLGSILQQKQNCLQGSDTNLVIHDHSQSSRQVHNLYAPSFFSSPDPKAQVSFSDSLSSFFPSVHKFFTF